MYNAWHSGMDKRERDRERVKQLKKIRPTKKIEERLPRYGCALES